MLLFGKSTFNVMVGFILVGACILSIGCQTKTRPSVTKTQQPTADTTNKKASSKTSTDTLDNDFADSTTIGVKGRYKVELKQFRNDTAFVTITLFEKQGTAWLKKQFLRFSQDQYMNDPDVDISDFNNDGLNDLTFKSVMPGNGANDVRKLLIFDKTKGKLVFIKNSENYPNMQYNKKLNCIDAWLVSGSYVTVFARLQKDTLKEFASVDFRDNIINVTVTDNNGHEKCLMKDKKSTKWSDTPRFTNFDPLTE